MGLAPMADLAEHQRQGIGSALARHGLDLLRLRYGPFVIVLGHPDYYPRIGLRPASSHGLRCHWPGIPEAAFMVAILDEPALQNVHGVVRCRDEFYDFV
jgi:putative acetyltransferase